MSRTLKAAAATGISLLLLFAMTGCALLPFLPHAGSAPTAKATEQAADDADVPNAAALSDWTDSQRSLIPGAQAAHPGQFSDVSVDTSIEEWTGGDEIPAGSAVNVVGWSYVYESPQDWVTTSGELDARFSKIEDKCQSLLFPEMRDAGVTGPISVTYYYTDGNSGADPEWTWTCSGIEP